MPREQTESERLSGIKNPVKLIIIASEGIKAETQYFNELERICDQNIVRPFIIRKTPDKKGHSAPQHVLKQMKDFKKNSSFKEGDEFWLVLDVDSWTNLEEIIATGAEDNIQMAISNPCFELWLLLHLKKVADLDDKERKALLQNDKVSKQHTYTSRFLGAAMKEVLGENCSKTRINAPSLMPYVDDAVTRAKDMTSISGIPEGLGSNVYRIVEQIQMGD